MSTIKQETAELNDYFGAAVFTAVHPKTLVHDAPARIMWGHRHPAVSVREVYERPSTAKLYFNEYFADACAQLDGFEFCITSHSCMFFTCEWNFVNPANGRPMHARATGKSVQAWYIDPATIRGERIGLWSRHGFGISDESIDDWAQHGFNM